MRHVFKHGVQFTEAATVFFDPYAQFTSNPADKEGDHRYTGVGHSLRDETLFVVNVHPGERFRIISARKANARERREYADELGRRL